ncbi:MAG TPA: nucleotidyltransferase family protein [Prolixibacteraceae bacterium]|jgi:hypothetical protein
MMTYKEIYYFTGQCLSLDEHPETRTAIVQKIENEDLHWEELLELWSDHLVIPSIYLKLKGHDLLDLLPPELTPLLRVVYEVNRVRNEKILQQIDSITEALEKRRIYPVFLKGSANLLDGLYGDVGERMIHDIDFLVKEENYLRTAAVLEGMGYCHDQPDYLDLKTLKHYPCLHKKGEPVVVEIHRLPVPEKYGEQYNAKLVFRDKKAVASRPGTFVPSDRHKLAHTFIHGQLADRGHTDKRSSFRAFNDLLLLSKRTPAFILPIYTRHKNKAISWLVFGQRVLGLPGQFYPIETKASRWFCLKYDLALSYGGIYRLHTFGKKLMNLLFVRYGGGLVKAVLHEDHRQSVYRRLKSRQWYAQHMMSYKNFF